MSRHDNSAEDLMDDLNEKFDYTKWQRGCFDKMSPDEFMEKAVRFEAEHPYSGQGKVLD